MNTVTIYTSATCPYSTSAKELLDQRGIRYQEIEIGDDTDQAGDWFQRARKLNVPQVFVGDTQVGGNDALKLAVSSGLFDALLMHDSSDVSKYNDTPDSTNAEPPSSKRQHKSKLSFQALASNKILNAVLFALVLISYAFSGLNAYAAESIDLDAFTTDSIDLGTYSGGGADLSWPVPTELRVLGGTDNFSDVRVAAFAYQVSLTRRFRINRFELASGVISADDQDRLFVSLGPVWRVPIGSDRTFAEFGLSPTILGGSSFGDRELGGNFHFTSSISLGTKFGAQENFLISLRAQHTSNGGIRNDNPGLDLFGFNVSYQFGR